MTARALRERIRELRWDIEPLEKQEERLASELRTLRDRGHVDEAGETILRNVEKAIRELYGEIAEIEERITHYYL